MKKIKWITLGLVLLIAIMQFFKPEKNQSDSVLPSDFILVEKPSASIENILRNACYDCHSDNTIYPWYNAVTPINYWLRNHVNEGRQKLNFSSWADNDPSRKDRKMDEITAQLKKSGMPLKSYTWIHKEARLTEDQKNEILSWISTLNYQL